MRSDYTQKKSQVSILACDIYEPLKQREKCVSRIGFPNRETIARSIDFHLSVSLPFLQHMLQRGQRAEPFTL